MSSSFEYEKKNVNAELEYFLKNNLSLIPLQFTISVPDEILKTKYEIEDSGKYIGSTHFMRMSLHVALDRKLKANDKLIFAFIETLLTFYKFAYASIGYISKMLGIGTRTVQKSLKRLEERGLIMCLKVNYHRRIYLIANLDEVYPEIVKDLTPRQTGWKVFAEIRDHLPRYFDSVREADFECVPSKEVPDEDESVVVEEEKKVHPIENNSSRKSGAEKVNRNYSPPTKLEDEAIGPFGIHLQQKENLKEVKTNSSSVQSQ